MQPRWIQIEDGSTDPSTAAATRHGATPGDRAPPPRRARGSEGSVAAVRRATEGEAAMWTRKEGAARGGHLHFALCRRRAWWRGGKGRRAGEAMEGGRAGEAMEGGQDVDEAGGSVLPEEKGQRRSRARVVSAFIL